MNQPQQSVCARVRLKPDSIQRVREWAQHIASHREDAIRTLIAEGVTIESVFLESNEEGDFLIYYMRSNSLEKAQAVAASSLAAIDEYHRQFKKDTWESVTRLELLIDLEVVA
jgi:hypothetical protein